MELALGIKLIKVMSLASAGYICPFSIKHRLRFWNIFTPIVYCYFLKYTYGKDRFDCKNKNKKFIILSLNNIKYDFRCTYFENLNVKCEYKLILNKNKKIENYTKMKDH